MSAKTAEELDIADCRPEVQRFAVLMERKLRDNDHKAGWHGDAAVELLARLVEESGELASFLVNHRGLPMSAWRQRVAAEAADVANFAMMIADVTGGLK
jgi:NTP pyrophosphatase (non-canonical NTP hydrolase)